MQYDLKVGPHGANWKLAFEPHTKITCPFISFYIFNEWKWYSMSENDKYMPNDELRTQKKYHRMKIDTN